MTTKTAILLGSTGLTGSILLEKLLKDDRYEKVKLFSRRPVGLQHEKIEEYLIDLFELEKYADLFKADDVFCCVGSTQKKTPNKETYRGVDFGIPATAARLSKQNGIRTFVVISALGANEGSNIFYNKTKGEMEGAVLEQKLTKTYILQPSLIGGKRMESRPFESAFKKIMRVVDNFLVGSMKKYKTVDPNDIAMAMLILANTDYSNNRITSDEISKIATIKA